MYNTRSPLQEACMMEFCNTNMSGRIHIIPVAYTINDLLFIF